MNKFKRIIIAAGLKGGVGKTEVVVSMIPKLKQLGHNPLLLDFDIENANKSGLQNFYPDALKFDAHSEGALDRLLDICDNDEHEIVIADLPAGASQNTAQFIEDIYDELLELQVKLTTIAVTNNDAGAVQSVLKYAEMLQDRTEYIVVLNELREPNSQFEYWYKEPAIQSFTELLSPKIITMKARIQELQAEMRNHTTTLEQIINGDVSTDYFRRTRNRVRAKSYQRALFEEFESVIDLLVPANIS